MSYRSAEDWKLAMWPPSSEDSLFARRMIATAFQRIAERILCSSSRFQVGFASCCGRIVLTYGVVARKNAAPPRLASSATRSSRYSARSGPRYCSTALIESTHSPVSTGSTSGLMSMGSLLGWRKAPGDIRPRPGGSRVCECTQVRAVWAPLLRLRADLGELGRHVLGRCLAELLAELLDDRLQFVPELRLLGRRELGHLHAVLLQLAERLVAVVADRLSLEEGRLARRLLDGLLLDWRERIPGLLRQQQHPDAVDVLGEHEVLLDLVELAAEDRRGGILLPVERSLLERVVELGKRHRQRVCAECVEGIDEQRVLDHPDLQSGDVGRVVDRPPAVGDLPEAVLPERESDEPLLRQLREQLLTKCAVEQRVGFLLVVEHEREVEHAEVLHQPDQGRAVRHRHLLRAASERGDHGGVVS